MDKNEPLPPADEAEWKSVEDAAWREAALHEMYWQRWEEMEITRQEMEERMHLER